MPETLTPAAFLQSEGVADWTILGDGACAYYPTRSFAASARFVVGIAALPGIAGHPPDVDIRPGGITVRLVTVTPEHYGMTTEDLEAARAISALARSLGLAADSSHLQSVLVIPGAGDAAAVMPFWEAALGYTRRPDSPGEDLIDPGNRGPAFWFETMEQLRGDGGGSIHIAVWVPPAHAEARVAEALAAGGHMVRDEFAPSWWTLADAAGNEIDISSISGRE